MAVTNYISDEMGFSKTTEGATEIRSREVTSSALKHQHNFSTWPVAECETNDAPQNATAMSAFSLYQPFLLTSLLRQNFSLLPYLQQIVQR